MIVAAQISAGVVVARHSSGRGLRTSIRERGETGLVGDQDRNTVRMTTQVRRVFPVQPSLRGSQGEGITCLSPSEPTLAS